MILPDPSGPILDQSFSLLEVPSQINGAFRDSRTERGALELKGNEPMAVSPSYMQPIKSRVKPPTNGTPDQQPCSSVNTKAVQEPRTFCRERSCWQKQTHSHLLRIRCSLGARSQAPLAASLVGLLRGNHDASGWLLASSPTCNLKRA